MIFLIDYRAGNLTSVQKALTALETNFSIPNGPAELTEAKGIIVPGVGHFSATKTLIGAWQNAILERVAAGTPLLGICVGMQWLFEGSDEAPSIPGLGVMKGQCFRLVGQSDRRLKVPHVGWNVIQSVPAAPGRLLKGVMPDSQVYFTHSYASPITSDCAAITTHGQPFASAVEREHIFGVQFHPEKSSQTGLRVLKNFLDVCQQKESD